MRLPPKHCLLHVQAIIWTRLAGVCPPEKMHWHPKPVFKADGTRVFGAGQRHVACGIGAVLSAARCTSRV